MIYLMRHGQAVSQSEVGDKGRWLTSKGRNEALRIGTRLHEKKLSLDAFVCSPLVRAVQTAEIVSRAMGFEGEIQVCGSLLPESMSDDAYNALRSYGEHILAVSHEDLVSRLCAQVTGTRNHYRTAEVRAISRDQLHWALHP